MKKIILELKTPFLISIVFLFICGLAYPLLITGVSQLVFPKQANGSLVIVNDEIVGSKLIGQKFTDPRFMKSRPSAVNYNTYTIEEKNEGLYSGVASGSTNFAATNPELEKRVEKDMAYFLKNNQSIKKSQIPADLLTASGSGLDPHISYESALVQLPEISEKSGLNQDELQKIVKKNTENKLIGIFGEKIVNVLGINIDIAKKINVVIDK
ncbi:MAG: K(+)-transporting ATPase subunit C [Carnobacterium sp.]|nr:K(+)-transporting ATPase subunit C [Carnobacterium sp.]